VLSSTLARWSLAVQKKKLCKPSRRICQFTKTRGHLEVNRVLPFSEFLVVKFNELRFALTGKSPIRELADPDQQKEQRKAYLIRDAISKLRKEKGNRHRAGSVERNFEESDRIHPGAELCAGSTIEGAVGCLDKSS
jgi:hypothetical protein